MNRLVSFLPILFVFPAGVWAQDAAAPAPPPHEEPRPSAAPDASEVPS